MRLNEQKFVPAGVSTKCGTVEPQKDTCVIKHSMNDSDFLLCSSSLSLFLLKVGHQGFPAIVRFFSRQHLAVVTPLQLKETTS